MLGTNLEILLNGNLLTDYYEQYLWLGNDLLASNWFEAYDLTFDLNSLFLAGLLQDGNNNIAFVIDTMEGDLVRHSHNDAGLLAFSADLSTGAGCNATPEPATMLIFGLGLVGLGLRRKLIRKIKYL